MAFRMKRVLQPLTNRRRRATHTLALFLILGAAPAGAAEADFDLVIRDGRIVDGSGNPWFLGDLAIRADRIVQVGRVPPGSARHELNARGLVVAPGFIDMHSHSDYLLLEDGRAESKIRQGVTLEVLGEGSSAGPFQDKLAPHALAGNHQPSRLVTLGDYFNAVEHAGVSVNILSYVGLGNLWECVMGQSFARPTAAEFARMKALLVAAMNDGAFGLSSQLMMPPGSLATTDDLVELCRTVREHGGLFACHTRNEGQGVFESVQEMIQIGERASLPVDILHLKIADQQDWGRMNEVVALIDQARRRGIDVQANIYPYTRGNNDLASIIPPWAHEGGLQPMLARLKDPAQRQPQAATRPARRALRSVGGNGWHGRDRLRAPHREGHEPGARPTLVFDRLGWQRLRHRWTVASRQPPSAQFRDLPARAGRVCARARALAPGGCRAQNDVAQRRQARPARPRPGQRRLLRRPDGLRP